MPKNRGQVVHPAAMPCLLFADRQGKIFDFPDLQMAGRSARDICRPELTDLIPLPEGSELFVLPHRYPAGFDPQDGQAAILKENPDNPAAGIQAVAAFISPAHASIHLTSFAKDESRPPPLPLFAYTAVGWY
ncbi:MAG: radical SAM protein, partial [Deltaproteobacteria bacterium]|nr:radical SAM protein [Deltaproteobacteria bacterium]